MSYRKTQKCPNKESEVNYDITEQYFAWQHLAHLLSLVFFIKQTMHTNFFLLLSDYRKRKTFRKMVFKEIWVFIKKKKNSVFVIPSH